MRYQSISFFLALPSVAAFVPTSFRSPTFTRTALSAVHDESVADDALRQLASTTFAASLFIATAFSTPAADGLLQGSHTAILGGAASPVSSVFVANAASTTEVKDPLAKDKESVAAAKTALTEATKKAKDVEAPLKAALAEEKKFKGSIADAEKKLVEKKAAVKAAEKAYKSAKGNSKVEEAAKQKLKDKLGMCNTFWAHNHGDNVGQVIIWRRKN